MTNVISVKKHGRKQPVKPGHAPLFRKVNYILMIVGAALLLTGYLLLRGGAVDDPNKFNEAIFNTRRMVVSPILTVLGLVTVIVAIMWRPRKKKDSAPFGTEE